MNLTKTSEYAIRILLYLSLNKDRLVTTRELNEKLNLSFKYIGRLLAEMVNAGLVYSERGKSGGYKINKSPKEIRLLDVINVVDDWSKYTQCMMGFGDCSEDNPCAIHDVWAPFREKMIQLFHNTTIYDLISHIHQKV